MPAKISNIPLKRGLIDTKGQNTAPVVTRISDALVVNPDNVMVRKRGSSTNIWQTSDPTDCTGYNCSETTIASYSWPTMSDDNGNAISLSNAVTFGNNSINRYFRYDKVSTTGIGSIWILSAIVIMDDASQPVPGQPNDGTKDLNFVIDSWNIDASFYSVTSLGNNTYRVSAWKTITNGGASRQWGVFKYTTNSAKPFKVSGIQLEEAGNPLTELEDETAFTAANYRISLHATASYFTGDDGAGNDIQNFAGTGNLIKVTIGGNSVYGYIGAAEGGEVLEAEEAAGTATADKLYKITASQVDHFYTGSVVNDYFVSDGAETLDVNNKVREVSTSDATGCTIYNSQALATEGWAVIESGFTVQPANGAAFTFEIYDNVLEDTLPRTYTATSGATATIPAEAGFDKNGLVNIVPVTNWLLQSNAFDQAAWTQSNH